MRIAIALILLLCSCSTKTHVITEMDGDIEREWYSSNPDL